MTCVAAIYAGSGGDSDAETVQAAADSMQQCFGASLAAVLVVADTSSHQLSRVTCVSGFVVGANGTTAKTTRSIFLRRAMFSASKTLNNIALACLLPVLGTADQPTVLAHALWLRGEGGRIVFASSADELVVRSARRVVAVPLVVGSWGWSELRQMSEAVRSDTPGADSQIFFAAQDAVAASLFPAHVAMVSILCAS